MKKNMKYVIFLVVLCMFLTGCREHQENNAENNGMTRFSAHFFDVFDTQTTVIGYAKDQETFDEKVDQIEEKLAYYHCLYDIYHTYEGMNNIKTINDNAGIEPVVVDSEIIELLKMSREMYELTSGKSILLWEVYLKSGMIIEKLVGNIRKRPRFLKWKRLKRLRSIWILRI